MKDVENVEKSMVEEVLFPRKKKAASPESGHAQNHQQGERKMRRTYG